MSFTDSDGFSRNGTGQFNPSDVGIDSSKQSDIGVNKFDTSVDVQRKNAEYELSQTIAKRAQDQNREYRYDVPSPSIIGYTFLFVAFLFFIGIGVLSIPNILRYRWPDDDVWARGTYAVRDALPAQISFEQEFALQRHPMFRAIFQPETSMNGLFAGCKKKCTAPDLQAFDVYKKHAVDPATYEDNICIRYFEANHANLARFSITPNVTYKFDRKANNCVVANPDEVTMEIRTHNRSALVQYWKIPVFLLIFICWAILYRRIYDEYKRRLAIFRG